MTVLEHNQEKYADSDMALADLAAVASDIYADDALEGAIRGEVTALLVERYGDRLDDTAIENLAEGMAREAVGHAFQVRGGTVTAADAAESGLEIGAGDRIILEKEDKTLTYAATETPDADATQVGTVRVDDDAGGNVHLPTSIGHVLHDDRYTVENV